MEITPMSNIDATLEDLLTLDGGMATALVDSSSGMILGRAGSGIDLDVAAAGNMEVIRAKLKTVKALGLGSSLEDILITLSDQYHIIRPLTKTPDVFIYLVLNRAKSNLALARVKVGKSDAELEL